MSNDKSPIITTKIPLAEQLGDERTSSLQRYRQKVLGRGGCGTLLGFELALMVSGNVQGGIGYLLRKKLLGPFFRKKGPGMILGRGLSLRHPGRIALGSNVAIDDYVLLDAGGAGEEGISLGDEVIISRNCVIQGKTGPVSIGSRTDIGVNTVISSASGIHIGREVLIAANCYLGGAQYAFDRLDIPIMDQGSIIKGPLRVGDGAWLGAGVTVLAGVCIGNGSIVGAGAVVSKDLPENVVAAGVPAQVIKPRIGEKSGYRQD